jgi:hypothetical protein
MKSLITLLDTQGGLLFTVCLSMLVFAGLTYMTTLWSPANTQAFQLFSNLTSSFAGALTMAAQIRSRLEAQLNSPVVLPPAVPPPPPLSPSPVEESELKTVPRA